jgi:hypothetical protein
MLVPGSNLLIQAFAMIAQTVIKWYPAAGRYLNSVGQDVTYYLDPVTIKCSFQPVPRNLYQTLGLDLQKQYFKVFAPFNLDDVARDVSSDQVVFRNQVFQCLSAQEWFNIDGWVEMLVVLTNNDPIAINSWPIFGFDLTAFQNFDNGPFPDEFGP